MKDEMVFLGAPDQATLLTPGEAQSRVSRQEFVNLMVCEYVDKTKAEIEARKAAEEALADVAAKAMQVAYEAWKAEIEGACIPRLSPWRDAVQQVLGSEMKLSELHADAIGVPVAYSFSGVNYNGGGYGGRSQTMPRLCDLFNGVLHRKGRVPEGVLTGLYEHPEFDLAKALMRWSFAPTDARYHDDYHAITISVDIRPSDATRALIIVAVDAAETYQEHWRETQRMLEEVKDDNIVRLERRALARLTKAALADNAPKLPAL